MRLIDADALGIGKCNPDIFEDKGYAKGWNSAIELVASAPTIDAVPVVRCRECRYVDIGSNDAEAWCDCTIFGAGVSEDGYCWLGQRREDSDEDG